MSRSPWGRCVTLVVALLAALGPSRAFAQSTASISGVVKDTAGSVLPGVSVTIKNEASGATQEVLTDGTGPVSGQRPRRWLLHGQRGADRVQGRGGERCSRRARTARDDPADARDRQSRRDGQRGQQLGVDQHPDGDGRGDAERRPAHPDADADAQRAERRHVPARRQHDRHQPRLDDQWPARRRS